MELVQAQTRDRNVSSYETEAFEEGQSDFQVTLFDGEVDDDAVRESIMAFVSGQLQYKRRKQFREKYIHGCEDRQAKACAEQLEDIRHHMLELIKEISRSGKEVRIESTISISYR